MQINVIVHYRAASGRLQAIHEGLVVATAGCLRLLRQFRLHASECLARATLVQVT